MMVTALVMEFEQPELSVMVSFTCWLPAVGNTYAGFMSTDVLPEPNSQSQEPTAAIFITEASGLKLTGLPWQLLEAVKSTTGAVFTVIVFEMVSEQLFDAVMIIRTE